MPIKVISANRSVQLVMYVHVWMKELLFKFSWHFFFSFRRVVVINLFSSDKTSSCGESKFCMTDYIQIKFGWSFFLVYIELFFWIGLSLYFQIKKLWSVCISSVSRNIALLFVLIFLKSRHVWKCKKLAPYSIWIGNEIW